MGVGQLLGWGVIQNFRGGGGLAKIVDTVFNAQFFSKKKQKKNYYYYYLKKKFSSLNLHKNICYVVKQD
jgi:hypothetical protein